MRTVSIFLIFILIGAGIGYLVKKTKYGVTIGGVLGAFLATMLYVSGLRNN